LLGELARHARSVRASFQVSGLGRIARCIVTNIWVT
jgi:hypothetical protein